MGKRVLTWEQGGRDCKAVCVASVHHPHLDRDSYMAVLGTRIHHPWVKQVPITPEAAFSLLKISIVHLPVESLCLDCEC